MPQLNNPPTPSKLHLDLYWKISNEFSRTFYEDKRSACKQIGNTVRTSIRDKLEQGTYCKVENSKPPQTLALFANDWQIWVERKSFNAMPGSSKTVIIAIIVPTCIVASDSHTCRFTHFIDFTSTRRSSFFPHLLRLNWDHNAVLDFVKKIKKEIPSESIFRTTPRRTMWTTPSACSSTTWFERQTIPALSFYTSCTMSEVLRREIKIPYWAIYL